MIATTLTKILIIRNDKLGDFTLSLPCFALLKQCLPSVELHALVPDYTRPIAEACPYIDHIITDPGSAASGHETRTLRETLRQQQYSAALTLYSTTRIGFLLARCHIPIRIAPATKLAQIFYNHRVRQRRSQSRKPEYQYNLDLARALLTLVGTNCDVEPTPPYLYFDPGESEQLKQRFCQEHHIAHGVRLVFVHPGSGGSANNLKPGQYAELARGLARDKQNFIVLSAGPGEYDMARALSTELSGIGHCVYESTEGLTQFARHIHFADVFISGSTGPLHLAGALDRPTVGFYTNRQSATSLRWQTLSRADRRLAFSPPDSAAPEDMSTVKINVALAEIQAMLSRLYPLTTSANP